MPTDTIFIEHQGHRTMVKWHRARRTSSDAEFTATRILEAMRLGASVEVDLVVHADDGFAILHDLTLDHGTTGTGPVAQTSAQQLRQLQLKGNDGEPIRDRVMLLEDLCDLLTANPAHPDALLQLDYKEDISRLSVSRRKFCGSRLAGVAVDDPIRRRQWRHCPLGQGYPRP